MSASVASPLLREDDHGIPRFLPLLAALVEAEARCFAAARPADSGPVHAFRAGTVPKVPVRIFLERIYLLILSVPATRVLFLVLAVSLIIHFLPALCLLRRYIRRSARSRCAALTRLPPHRRARRWATPTQAPPHGLPPAQLDNKRRSLAAGIKSKAATKHDAKFIPLLFVLIKADLFTLIQFWLVTNPAQLNVRSQGVQVSRWMLVVAAGSSTTIDPSDCCGRHDILLIVVEGSWQVLFAMVLAAV